VWRLEPCPDRTGPGSEPDEVFSTLSGQRNAVVVARRGRPVGVLTRSDLLEYLAHNRG
jgi:predicted transcriptional regulator